LGLQVRVLRSIFAAVAKRGKLVAVVLVALSVGAAGSAFAADLQVSGYSWSPDPVANSAGTEFSVRVTNNGPGAVSDAVVTIGVSSRFRVDAGGFPSYCVLAGAVGAQSLTCALPALAVGDQSSPTPPRPSPSARRRPRRRSPAPPPMTATPPTMRCR
jgi:hypothetical protein